MQKIIAFFNQPRKAVAFFTVVALLMLALVLYVAPRWMWAVPAFYALCLAAVAIEDIRRFNDEHRS